MVNLSVSWWKVFCCHFYSTTLLKGLVWQNKKNSLQIGVSDRKVMSSSCSAVALLNNLKKIFHIRKELKKGCLVSLQVARWRAWVHKHRKEIPLRSLYVNILDYFMKNKQSFDLIVAVSRLTWSTEGAYIPAEFNAISLQLWWNDGDYFAYLAIFLHGLFFCDIWTILCLHALCVLVLYRVHTER